MLENDNGPMTAATTRGGMLKAAMLGAGATAIHENPQ